MSPGGLPGQWACPGLAAALTDLWSGGGAPQPAGAPYPRGRPPGTPPHLVLIVPCRQRGVSAPRVVVRAGCLHWGLAGVSHRETREVPSTRAWGTLTLKLRKREAVAPGFQGGRAGGHWDTWAVRSVAAFLLSSFAKVLGSASGTLPGVLLFFEARCAYLETSASEAEPGDWHQCGYRPRSHPSTHAAGVPSRL